MTSLSSMRLLPGFGSLSSVPFAPNPCFSWYVHGCFDDDTGIMAYVAIKEERRFEPCHRSSQRTYETYLLLRMWNNVVSLPWHTSRIQKGDLTDTLTRHNDLWLRAFRLFVTCLQTATLIFCGATTTPVTYLQICLHCCQGASWFWEAMRSRLPSVLGHQPQSSSQHHQRISKKNGQLGWTTNQRLRRVIWNYGPSKQWA